MSGASPSFILPRKRGRMKEGGDYRFGINISFNLAINDGCKSYRLAKVLAVVEPSIGATSNCALSASATNSRSRKVFMKACCSVRKRSGGVAGATEKGN